MPADRFASILSIAGRKWKCISIGIGIVFLGCLGAFNTISFDDNFELMLPGDRVFVRGISFLRESQLSGQVVLSLRLDGPSKSFSDLVVAADLLAEKIRSPLIDEVVTGKSLQEQFGDVGEIIQLIPSLLSEDDLKTLEERLSDKEIEKSLRAIYLRAMNPASGGGIGLSRSDPLGIGSNVLKALDRIYRNMEFDVSVKSRHLVSRDEGQIMILLKTGIPVADGEGSRKLLAWIDSRIALLPSEVAVDVVCGHRHTLSNETIIRSDVRIAIGAAAVGFALLFLLVFRDVRALLIFVIPFVSMTFSVVFSSLFFQRVSFFIVGMGGVIAGITVDYGIHVFMAVRNNGGDPGAAKKIVRPVVFSALTTSGIFVAFLFSGVAGYRQLGVFSMISIFFCLIISLFLLPYWLAIRSEKNQKRQVRFDRIVNQMQTAKWLKWGWGLCLCLLLLFSFRAGFESDIRQMDGSAAEVILSEERLLENWGKGDPPAIFIVPNSVLEDALLVNEAVFQEAVNAIGEENFTSIASLLPSQKTRTRNIQNWTRFWDGRVAPLESKMREIGMKFGFRGDAFEPFYRFLQTDPSLAIAAGEQMDSNHSGWLDGPLRERFVTTGGGEYRVLSFFPDEDSRLDAMQGISKDHPGTFVVSRKQISRDLSRAVKRQMTFLSVASGILIVALTLLVFRDFRLSMSALIPVFSGLVAICGVFGLTDGRLNAAGLMAAVMVMGLCIDYGIFMVYAGRHALGAGTSTAVAVSAITTVIGASALLFASHPALHNIGVVLVSGIAGGFAGAVFLVPALCGNNRKQAHQDA